MLLDRLISVCWRAAHTKRSKCAAAWLAPYTPTIHRGLRAMPALSPPHEPSHSNSLFQLPRNTSCLNGLFCRLQMLLYVLETAALGKPVQNFVTTSWYVCISLSICKIGNCCSCFLQNYSNFLRHWTIYPPQKPDSDPSHFKIYLGLPFSIWVSSAI